jgi:thiopurine S-methyltransferase
MFSQTFRKVTVMDAQFWHDRWASNEIGFHRSEANPLLVKYFNELALDKGSRVLVPLCGKTLDIPWLLSNGYRVAGAELSAMAIEQLFAQLNIHPRITRHGELDHYQADSIDIFVGDVFKVTKKVLGPVDAIYDRAALVALPPDMRSLYAVHLPAITDHAPQLLISYEYDQRLAEGPPFSVSKEEIHRQYEGRYKVRLLTSLDVPGGLKGKCAATEHVWLLRKDK